MDEKPVGFLSLPRELRDKVYTYLLSSDYIRYPCNELTSHSLRKGCSYHFVTSILYVNKQIYHEASHTFHMSNLFVHIYCNRSRVKVVYDRCWRSIPANVQHAPRHAMKVEIRFGGEPHNDYVEPQYIIACNDLPAFCRRLLCQERYSSGTITFVDLRLVIRNEVDTTMSSTEEDTTESYKPIERYPAARDMSVEGAFLRTNNKSDIPNPRVRRLLEPFRRLHNIRHPQIMGPLSESYKAEIAAEMRKPLPRNQHGFDHMFLIFRAAMDNFGYKDFELSVLELRNTIEELRNVWRPGLDGIIVKGPYAGFTVGEAYESIEFTLETKLAWACVKTGDFHTAQIWRTRILPRFLDNPAEWVYMSPKGLKMGMVFYLNSQLIQGCDHADCDGHTRSYYLDDAIKALEKGLRHEPGNRLLVEELRRLKLELLKEEEIED